MAIYHISYEEFKERASRLIHSSDNIPCAYCQYGGNGDRSCAAGMNRRHYSKFQNCREGKLLEKAPY